VKHSELLRAAKAYIDPHRARPNPTLGRAALRRGTGPTPYICWALERVKGAPPSVVVDVRNRIMGRLEGDGSFGGWLLRRVDPDRYFSEWATANGPAIQQHRLDWMEMLAKEYEEEGR